MASHNKDKQMKTKITLLIMLLAMISTANFSFAQEEEEENVPDTTRFKLGNTEFIIIDQDTMKVTDIEKNEDDDDKDDKMSWEERGDLAHWTGFDVGVNLLMNNNFENKFEESHLDLDPAKSFYYGFNLFEYFIKFGTPHVGLTTGLGFSHTRFGLKDPYLRLTSNNDSTFAYADSSLLNGFKTNQLRISHFNIPVLFTFNTSKNKKKNFHVSLGVIGGVRIASKMKYKYEVTEGNTDQSTQGRYNINPFHATATVRIGFRKIGIFANYNLLPLFEENKSRVAMPLTFGASIML